MPDVCFNKILTIPVQNAANTFYEPMLSCLVDASDTKMDKPYFINDIVYADIVYAENPQGEYKFHYKCCRPPDVHTEYITVDKI